VNPEEKKGQIYKKHIDLKYKEWKKKIRQTSRIELENNDTRVHSSANAPRKPKKEGKEL